MNISLVVETADGKTLIAPVRSFSVDYDTSVEGHGDDTGTVIEETTINVETASDNLIDRT